MLNSLSGVTAAQARPNRGLWDCASLSAVSLRAESRQAPMSCKPAALPLCFAFWGRSVKNVQCGGWPKGALTDPLPSFALYYIVPHQMRLRGPAQFTHEKAIVRCHGYLIPPHNLQFSFGGGTAVGRHDTNIFGAPGIFDCKHCSVWHPCSSAY